MFDIRNPQQMRMKGGREDGRTGGREEGRKGGREEGRKGGSRGRLQGEQLLADHDCGFVGSGGFGFRIMDFEFVWDLNIGISDILFGCGRLPR